MLNRLNVIRSVAVLAAAAVSCGVPMTAGAQNIGQDMRNFFDDMRGSVQVSGAQAFHGQTYHTYMGGGIYQRMPTRNLQLASIQMPRFSAGCGGIDMYLGSISHLDGDKLVDFLRATAMNMQGVVTQVALKAITPLLGSTLEWAKDVVDKINGFNLNSCEVAKSAVAGGLGLVTMNEDSKCVELKMVYENLNVNEAREECQSAADQKSTLRAARDDPARRDLVGFTGNLTWEALKKVVPGASVSERELILSIVGTMVYPRNDAAGDEGRRLPTPVDATIENLADLLHGTSGGAADGRIRIEVLSCGGDTESCMNPVKQERDVASFTQMVSEEMQQIADAIRNRDPITTEMRNFVNQTTLPVWKMMQIGTLVQGSSMAEQLIAHYKDEIAADYAWALLSRALVDGHKALRQNFNFDSMQEAHARELREHLQSKLKYLLDQRAAAQRQRASLHAVANDLERLERQLRSQMPQQMVDMLAASKSGR